MPQADPTLLEAGPSAGRWPAWLQRPAVHAAALILLTLLLYLPSYRNGFVWDDDRYVTANQTLRTLGGLWDIWFKHGSTVQYYPMTFTSFWLEYRLWGLHPAGYHLTNALLHGLNALLWFTLLRRLAVPGAWLAAAVFALHPLHVETAAWITERKNTLSAALYLGAALCLVGFYGHALNRKRGAGLEGETGDERFDWRWYGVGVVLFTLALLAKSVASTLPCAVLLVVWWKTGRLRWRHVWPMLPLIALGAAAGQNTAWIERHYVQAVGSSFDSSFADRLVIAGRILWFYLGKLLVPTPMTFIYPRWSMSAAVPAHWLWCLGFVGLVGALAMLAWRRGRRGPLTAILYFAGTCVPALGFVNVFPMQFSFVADHFCYLAGMGVIAAVIGSACWLLHRSTAPPLLALALLPLAVMTWQRQAAYRDAFTLWQDTAQRNPQAWIAHQNLGSIHLDRGEAQAAQRCFQRVIELQPDSAGAHAALGAALAQQRDWPAAESAYRRAIDLGMATHQVYYVLGQIQLHQRKRIDAIDSLQRAIALFPADAVQRVKLDDAAALHQQYLRTHVLLAKAYYQVDRRDDAARTLQDLLRIEPDHAEARALLGKLGAEAP